MAEVGERKDDPVQPKPAATPEKKLDWSEIADKADEEQEAKNKQSGQKLVSTGQTPTKTQLPSDSVSHSPQPRQPKASGDIKVSLQITKEGVSRSCSVDEANAEKKSAHKGRETQEKKREMMDSHWSLSKVDLNEKKNTEQRRSKGTQQERKEKNSADERSDEQEPAKNERDNENENSKESTPHLDMKHGFVRDIIRNQLDRDAFEQRWQQQQLEKKKQEEEEKKTQEEEHRKKKDPKGRKPVAEDPLTTKSWGHDGFHELAAMEEKETMERSKKFEEQEQKRRLSHEERMKTRKPLTDSQPLYVPPSRREGYKPRVSSGGTPEASPGKESESKPTPSKAIASPSEKTPVKEQQQEASRRPQRERNSSGQAATPTQGRPRNSEGNSRKTPQSGSSSSSSSKVEEQTNRQVERGENRGHQKKDDAAHKGQYRRKDQASAADEKPVGVAGNRNSDRLDADVDANVVEREVNEDLEGSDDGEDPILFVGIELPDGQTAKMTVFKGDDPRKIAEEFCTKHSLSEIHIETIRQNIEYQLAPLDADSS